jgi:hypothetical protein
VYFKGTPKTTWWMERRWLGTMARGDLQRKKEKKNINAQKWWKVYESGACMNR